MTEEELAEPEISSDESEPSAVIEHSHTMQTENPTMETTSEETVIRQDYTVEKPTESDADAHQHWLDKNSNEGMGAEGQLTIDVFEQNDIIVIKSTIAGVKPEGLDVNIHNDMVTIKGERKKDNDVPEAAYYYQELYWGKFSRSVILPSEVQHEKIEASMKNGILTIKLPKKEESKMKKISVKGL